MIDESALEALVVEHELDEDELAALRNELDVRDVEIVAPAADGICRDALKLDAPGTHCREMPCHIGARPSAPLLATLATLRHSASARG